MLAILFCVFRTWQFSIRLCDTSNTSRLSDEMLAILFCVFSTWQFSIRLCDTSNTSRLSDEMLAILFCVFSTWQFSIRLCETSNPSRLSDEMQPISLFSTHAFNITCLHSQGCIIITPKQPSHYSLTNAHTYIKETPQSNCLVCTINLRSLMANPMRLCTAVSIFSSLFSMYTK